MVECCRCLFIYIYSLETSVRFGHLICSFQCARKFVVVAKLKGKDAHREANLFDVNIMRI